MRIYFSTTSSDIPKARALIQQVREAGHTITYDWTEGFDREAEMDKTELAVRAQADIQGVQDADAVIVYMQPSMATKMTGAAVENRRSLGDLHPHARR